MRRLDAAPTRVAAAALLLAAACPGCRQPAPSPAPAPAASEPAGPVASLLLFYVDAEGRLQREGRQVPALPVALPARVRLVLEELLAGSQQGLASPFPFSPTVRTVLVDGKGTAYVDLTPAPPPGSVQGTSAEVCMVYAVVDAVVANCPGIERVQVLFDGQEVETLGHLDLSRPLLPQTGLLAR